MRSNHLRCFLLLRILALASEGDRGADRAEPVLSMVGVVDLQLQHESRAVTL
jgi:hypothetical protein